MRAARHLLALLIALTLSATALAGADGERLRVVATIPDLADITAQIGGERVDISTIAKGKENLHFVLARPSHLVALSKADALVQVGLSMEMAFVPGLLESCGNPKVRPGGAGFINCSDGWQAIQVPEVLSRQGGDLHPQGNPHMNIDPRGGRHFAQRICEGLARVAPQWKGEFEARRDAYLEQLARAEARWNEIGSHWKGRKLVEYHQEYDYLVELYGIERVAYLEVKPGIPPTPNHLAGVIEAMRGTGCRVIATALWSRNDYVARVSEATGAQVVELPNMCGGIPGSETWIGMMDLLHERLAKAFGTPVPAR